jgi:hypothetical protein
MQYLKHTIIGVLAAPLLCMVLPINADCQPHWDQSIGQPGLSGQNSTSLSIGVHDGWLYVGGLFSHAGGVFTPRIARWNGVAWWPMGSGMNQTVWGLYPFDDGTGENMYLAGNFTQAGGVSANKLARWNGISFSAMGAGVQDDGAAITFYGFDEGDGETLFVAGNFVEAGDTQVNYIARWHPDTETYSSVGGGTNSQINTLVAFDDGNGEQLYAGGWFTQAGGASANRIARWNPTTQQWSTLGDGFEGPVLAMAVYDDGNGPALYVGGAFTNAGGAEFDYVARWDTDQEAWSIVGGEMDGGINDMIVYDDGTGAALYATGWFQNIGGQPINRIARWDGQSWSPLGQGINASGRGFAIYEDSIGSALYVVGSFSTADGQPASSIAAWRGCETLLQGDLNGDGVVNVSDLLILLGNWGPCEAGSNCPADLNGDGEVNVSDLLILLGNWG